jgi:hypothetical protein
MTDADPTPRTAEQHDAVRRRSRILSLCGLFCAVLALVLLLGRASDQPPNVFAVNLSFCAMMIGIGLVFYVKGTPGAGFARTASLAAILLGFAGTLFFMFHGLHFRKERETRELDRVAMIVKRATRYAHDHGGAFPDSLSQMLLDRYLTLEDVRSSYATLQKPSDRERLQAELAALQAFEPIEKILPNSRAILVGPLRVAFDKDVEQNSDYQYFGAGLAISPKGPKPELPQEIIIAASRYAISGSEMTVGFANGTAEFLNLGNAESALRESNEARTALGFEPIRPPELIQHAQKYKTAPSAPGN